MAKISWVTKTWPVGRHWCHWRQEFEAAEWFERMTTACVSFSKVVLQRSDSADHEHENHVWPCMITMQHQWRHIWWHVPRFNPVWPSSSLNFGFRPPPESFMERNLSDQKLSLCSAVAVLNKMFLTQNLSPYPLSRASSTVAGTCQRLSFCVIGKKSLWTKSLSLDFLNSLFK